MKKDIRTFNRFELKYFLTLDQVEKFKKDLLKYVVPDEYGGSDGTYMLSSLYFDTNDYKFYWEKVDGIKFRRKLRIRRYVTNEPFTLDSKVYAEIKQRVDRVTQKRRVPMTYREALELVYKYKLPEKYSPEDKVVLDEILHFAKSNNIKSTAITTYNRQAFFGTENDAGLRITFDTYVSYKKEDLDLSNADIEGYMLPTNFSIMEVKANDKVPYWITQLIASHNIPLIRISKYCQAIETAGVYAKSLSNAFNYIKAA